MWNVEFCKRLKCEYRIIVVNIQTIKSMLKELSVAVWFLWAPINTGTQVCTLGKWAETQPHSLSLPFSTALSTQLSSTHSNVPPPHPSLQVLVVTQLWSSAPLARFPKCHDPAQARSWGSLRDIWSYIIWAAQPMSAGFPCGDSGKEPWLSMQET